jgi:hypothetical protein
VASHAAAQRWALSTVAQAAGDLPAPLKKIVTAFQMVPDPMQRYKQLLFYAAKLKALPAEHHTPDNKVQGCVSQASAPPPGLTLRRAPGAVWPHARRVRGSTDLRLGLGATGLGAADAAGRQSLFPGRLGLAVDQGARAMRDTARPNGSSRAARAHRAWLRCLWRA